MNDMQSALNVMFDALKKKNASVCCILVIAIFYRDLQRQLESHGRMRLSIKVITIIDAVMQNVSHRQVQDLLHINLEEGGIFE